MLTVSNNAILLTRGDTADFTVPIKNLVTDEEYEMAIDDTLTFTVKKKETELEALISRESIGSNSIHLRPEDTKDLSFGKYVYDVQLTTANGDVYTVIAPTIFELGKEVTY